MIKKQKWVMRGVHKIFFVLITFAIALIFTHDSLISLAIGVLNFILQISVDYVFDTWPKKIAPPYSRPAVIFFTGLSGSGKTTIARALMAKFRKNGIEPVLLDGDEIRQAINQTGFDEYSRKNHNLNVGYMASLLEAKGHFVIVSLISPYEETRDTIRRMCKNFKEVYVSTLLEVCIRRDTKGLYAKALNGEIMEFTGISSPYFPPKNPEVTIDTDQLSIDKSVDNILKALCK